MFDTGPKNTLSELQTLAVIQVHLAQAREAEDTEIKLFWCDSADSLLGPLKTRVKRPGPGNKNNGDQILQQRIASAYLEHADLLTDLGGHMDKARKSLQRAEKWG